MSKDDHNDLRSITEMVCSDPWKESHYKIFGTVTSKIEPKPLYDADMNGSHYKLNEHGIECIDAMQAMLTKVEFIGYLRGNIFKYQWRYKYKGKAEEDLKKAKWYFKKLLEIEGVENA